VCIALHLWTTTTVQANVKRYTVARKCRETVLWQKIGIGIRHGWYTYTYRRSSVAPMIFFFFLNNPLHFLAGAFFSETLFLVFLESLHVCIMSSIVTICNHCQTYFVIVDNHRYLNEHKLSKSYKLFSYIHQ